MQALKKQADGVIADMRGEDLYKCGLRCAEAQNFQQAARWFQKAAEQNHPEAQFELGMYYNEGKGGLKRDLHEAARWFQEAVNHHHARAQYMLGMYCHWGEGGLIPDDKKAARCFQEAATRNHAEAQYMIGKYYDEGEGGLPEDCEEAAKWFQKAAVQGHAGAQYYIGAYYQYGTGVVKCLAVAIIYYQLAADQADQNSEVAKEALQEIGENAIQRNRLKPGEDPYTLDDLKNPEIQCRIGKLYQLGNQYTEQDLQVAVAWFQQAADQGHGEAQYRLGMCHRNGIGTAKNEERASYWLAKSNERGYAPATAAQKFANKKQVFTIDEETDKEIHDHRMTGYTKK